MRYGCFMTTTETTMREMLIAMGCREWVKGSMVRIYVPVEVSCRLLGLRVSRYGSGNISNATRNGDQISNAEARDMLGGLESLFYDVQANKFRWAGAAYADEVASALRERLASQSAPVTA
jgi:hypothetical protein